MIDLPSVSLEDRLIEAYRVATRSPDPSTQNGAILLRDDKILCSSSNSFPVGVENKPERLERPDKYAFVEHAERGVIYVAARRGIETKGTTMIVPWFACSDCARAIICAGVSHVVGHQNMMDATPDHWKESIAVAFQMLDESGVTYELISAKLGAPQIRFNGELWQP